MSDSKGRPTAADIPDLLILRAVKDYRSGGQTTPDQQGELDRWPSKVILAKMDKLRRRGLLECGVSLRTGWLTPKGEETLQNLSISMPTFGRK